MHDACLTIPYWKVWPTVKRSSERGGHTDGTNRDRAISDHISDAVLQKVIATSRVYRGWRTFPRAHLILLCVLTSALVLRLHSQLVVGHLQLPSQPQRYPDGAEGHEPLDRLEILSQPRMTNSQKGPRCALLITTHTLLE